MSVALASPGTVVWAAAQTLAVPYPAGTASDQDALVLTRMVKPDTATLATPTGWTVLDTATGGVGVLANDTGPLKVVRYWRQATGAESGNLTVDSTPATVDVQGGYISRWSKAAGTTWSLAGTGGPDNTAGTDWSSTMAANPGLTTGDQVEAFVVWQTDSARTWSSEVLAATGATIAGVSVPVTVGSTALGADMAARVHQYQVTAGTATAAPVYTATASAATNMTGATSLVRLREVITSTGGPLAATLPALTATAAGTARTSGALTAALPRLTATAVGAARTTGPLAVVLPAPSAALAGTVTNPDGPVARPNIGTVTRPRTGLVVRPDAGTVTRP